MNSYSKILLRFSALYALLGAFLGSHMAGSDSYQYLHVHVHILVIGWLSLFAFAIFYQVFKPADTIIVSLHVWTAIIGSIGVTTGMWFRYVGPFGIDTDGAFPLILFIVGGTILVISFLFFAILTFMRIDLKE